LNDVTNSTKDEGFPGKRSGSKKGITYSITTPTAPRQHQESAAPVTDFELDLRATMKPTIANVTEGKSRGGKWLLRIRSEIVGSKALIPLSLSLLGLALINYLGSKHSVSLELTVLVAVLVLCLVLVAVYYVQK
jgi:hypothetical protein